MHLRYNQISRGSRAWVIPRHPLFILKWNINQQRFWYAIIRRWPIICYFAHMTWRHYILEYLNSTIVQIHFNSMILLNTLTQLEMQFQIKLIQFNCTHIQQYGIDRYRPNIGQKHFNSTGLVICSYPRHGANDNLNRKILFFWFTGLQTMSNVWKVDKHATLIRRTTKYVKTAPGCCT